MTSSQQRDRARDDAKASNDFGRFAAQAAILINGGAATATLAFLANGNTSLTKSLLPLVPLALTSYALGVFLAAISLIAMSKSLQDFMNFWDSASTGAAGNRWWNAGLILIFLSMILFIGASFYLAWGVSGIGIR